MLWLPWTDLEKREATVGLLLKSKMKDLSGFVDEHMARRGLLFEPGTKFSYADGHTIVAAVVAHLAGKPFQDYVKDHITGPLGMCDTEFLLSPAQSKRIPSNAHDVVDLDHPYPPLISFILRKLGFSMVPSLKDMNSKPTDVRGDIGLKGTVAT